MSKESVVVLLKRWANMLCEKGCEPKRKVKKEIEKAIDIIKNSTTSKHTDIGV